MVRHFVGHHSQRSGDTQTRVSHECSRNQNAIPKRVHAVTQQHGPAATQVVVSVVLLMRLVAVRTMFMRVIM
jgi:hypothetical protein